MSAVFRLAFELLIFVQLATGALEKENIKYKKEIYQFSEYLRGGEKYGIYKNLWNHNKKWLALVSNKQDKNNCNLILGISSDSVISKISVSSPQGLLSNTKKLWKSGITLFIDFPFGETPSQLFWLEILIPIFEALRQYKTLPHKKQNLIINHVILNGLSNKQMTSWFLNVLQIVLYPDHLPKLAVSDVKHEIKEWKTYEDLENYGISFYDAEYFKNIDSLLWIGFEKILVVRNRYTHESKASGIALRRRGHKWKGLGCGRYVDHYFKLGFSNLKNTELFRKLGLQIVALSSRGRFQKFNNKNIIAYVSCKEEPGIYNKSEFLSALSQIANTYGWLFEEIVISTQDSFTKQISDLADSKIIIGQQGSATANALFLPPGSGVFELVAYNTDWEGTGQILKNITKSMSGSIFYGSWTASSSEKGTVFKNSRDRLKYQEWNKAECEAVECIKIYEEAMINVDLENFTSSFKSYFENFSIAHYYTVEL